MASTNTIEGLQSNLPFSEKDIEGPVSTAPSTKDQDVLPTDFANLSVSIPASDLKIGAMEAPKSGKLYIPLAIPMAGCTPTPAPILTENESKMYDELLAQVLSWVGIPKTVATTDKGGYHHLSENGGTAYQTGLDPLTDDDRMFLTRQCLLRYLRAVKFSSVDDAAKRVMMTLTWRREYGVPFSADYISPENETGKQVVLGFDTSGRPCLYLNPKLQNTKVTPRQNQHLVYMLSCVIDLMPPGQEMLTLCVNFKGMKPSGGVSLGQAREVLNILQYHYPERLGYALITDVPWYIKLFFDLITPFIDPRTKEKIQMKPTMKDFIPADHLFNSFGGNVDFEYDHSKYWPALTSICEERRRLFRERWTKLGSVIGEDESKLHGIGEPSSP